MALREGEKVVRELWAAVEKGDLGTIKKLMARGFQSVHPSGANSRAEEIKLIKGLHAGKCTVSHVRATQVGPVLVVTYCVSAAETIRHKRVAGKHLPRLSVFLKTDAGWQWIAHANFAR